MRAAGETSPRWAPAVLLLAACAAVYGAAVARGSFQYDDLPTVVENPAIRSLSNWGAWFTDPAAFSGLSFASMYRPLVVASYGVTHALAGLAAPVFVGTNLLLHAGCTLLVWRFLAALGYAAVPAVAGALLFCLHPVNTEAVAYVSSRSESMMALFALATVILWLRQADRPAARAVAALLLAAGLLCKSVAIVVPGLLLLIDVGLRRRSVDEALVRRHAFVWIVAIGYLLIVRGSVGAALITQAVRSPYEQWLTQMKALPYYAHLLALPRGLSVEHAFRESGNLLEGAVALSFLLVGSAVALLWRGMRTHGALRLFGPWPLLVLLPVIVVPLNVLVNERRLYLVSVALAALAAWLASTQQVRAWRVPGIAVLCLLAVLALQRSLVWGSAEALWSDAREKAPTIPRVHLFLGDVHLREGRLTQALAAYDTALAVNPSRLTAGDRLALHNNRGAALLELGRESEARQAYARALAIDPTYPPARVSMAALQGAAQVTRDEEAARLARSGMEALAAGDLPRARMRLRASVDRQSDDATWMSLATASIRLGDTAAATAIYRRLVDAATEARFARLAQRRLDSLAVMP
jgi:tetratricopeptide (TPR) repeat protein